MLRGKNRAGAVAGVPGLVGAGTDRTEIDIVETPMKLLRQGFTAEKADCSG